MSAAALVPRPETELLVQAALELVLPDGARVLDIGTGSGCIALTLAGERAAWKVMATDRSLAALEVARANFRVHGVDVVLLLGDLGASLRGPFDLIVANLPYVPTSHIGGLSTEVHHDPIMALDGGEDGLDLVRRLIDDLPRLLAADGRVVLEIGEGQVDEVSSAAEATGFVEVRRIVDLGGCDRILVLRQI